MEPIRHYVDQEVKHEPIVAPEPQKKSKYKKEEVGDQDFYSFYPILLFIFGFFVVPMLYILYLSFISQQTILMVQGPFTV